MFKWRSREPKCSIVNAPCPKNGEPEKGNYCPHWVGVLLTNTGTGATKVVEACGKRADHDWMVEVRDASHITGNFVSGVANRCLAINREQLEVIDGVQAQVRELKAELNRVTPVVAVLAPAVKQLLESQEDESVEDAPGRLAGPPT